MTKQRKVEFIKTAMKLFAEKGYYSTSIQDIVEAWGISKGAFYHHFSSKEELMLSVVKYYLDQLFSQFIHAKHEGEAESEREVLIKQLEVQLESIHSQKDFFQMVVAEQIPKINENLHSYLRMQRSRIFNWHCQRLIEVYGQKVERYVYDVAAMLSGILREYTFYMMFHPNRFQSKEIAAFIVRRLDAIVMHFSEHEEPLLKQEIVHSFMEMAEQEKRKRKMQMMDQMESLKKKLSSLSLDKKTYHQLHSALDTLEAEFMNEQSAPREYVVKGILLYIESQQLHPLCEALDSLKEAVHEYMAQHH
ncbi:TetR family transcriptional regulator [Anoxybacillus sp. UARK-01]|uniref:TetR/AcrR family transcriptional regulator n=1 Tax=Anoxybacillus sp. UARK-01 TaxID=1895648 RepID=UPI0009BBE6F3|nr:TetR/AcrR family transcriptional regulator [Anoxybacillus sp. UARK-01]OQM45942.1 TetR family transcriptional regulator [Anoxybacillus sp. UARK-01]